MQVAEVRAGAWHCSFMCYHCVEWLWVWPLASAVGLIYDPDFLKAAVPGRLLCPGDVAREGKGSSSIPSDHFVLIVQPHSMGLLGVKAWSAVKLNLSSWGVLLWAQGGHLTPACPVFQCHCCPTGLGRGLAFILLHPNPQAEFWWSLCHSTPVLCNSCTSSSPLQAAKFPMRRLYWFKSKTSKRLQVRNTI